jgi:hypothetical protein
LDAKIAALEEFRSQVDAKLKSGVGVQANAEALRKVSASLAHAKDARYAMNNSCCNQNCEIDWQDV